MARFNVPDMSCGHCTAAIEKAVLAADASAKVSCDIPSHTVDVESTLDAAALMGVLSKAGYEATAA